MPGAYEDCWKNVVAGMFSRNHICLRGLSHFAPAVGKRPPVHEANSNQELIGENTDAFSYDTIGATGFNWNYISAT